MKQFFLITFFRSILIDFRQTFGIFSGLRSRARAQIRASVVKRAVLPHILFGVLSIFLALFHLLIYAAEHMRPVSTINHLHKYYEGMEAVVWPNEVCVPWLLLVLLLWYSGPTSCSFFLHRLMVRIFVDMLQSVGVHYNTKYILSSFFVHKTFWAPSFVYWTQQPVVQKHMQTKERRNSVSQLWPQMVAFNWLIARWLNSLLLGVYLVAMLACARSLPNLTDISDCSETMILIFRKFSMNETVLSAPWPNPTTHKKNSA